MAEDLKHKTDAFRQIAVRAAAGKNRTLAADVVAAMARVRVTGIDFRD